MKQLTDRDYLIALVNLTKQYHEQICENFSDVNEEIAELRKEILAIRSAPVFAAEGRENVERY